jgi:2'-5' RNA ligase
MVRTFIAVDIDPQVREKISRAITQLRPRFLGVRWVAPANFHLTLKFLGDTEQTRIEAIGAALEERLRPFPRCTINAKGLGVFPALRQAKILWVGFFGDELARLAANIDRALLALEFSAEPREFTPHLTIGRWRHVDRSALNLKQELHRWRDRDFGATIVDRVSLFQSDLKPTGAVYSQLKVIKLNDQAID